MREGSSAASTQSEATRNSHRPCRSFHRAVTLAFALVGGATQLPSALLAQEMLPLRGAEEVPAWVEQMYGPEPNLFAIDRAYREHYLHHAFEKNYHTQYYKRWRRSVERFVDAEGFVQLPTPAERKLDEQRYFALVGDGEYSQGGPTWRFVGPEETWSDAASGTHIPVSWQANVYCIARSASHPDVLYCGTEGGGLFKTVDGGMNWAPATDVGVRVYGVHAVEIHPTDPNTVLFGSGIDLYRTTDGGTTWTSVLTWGGMTVNDIAIHPEDPNYVWAATSTGLFRSTDGGVTFQRENNRASYDMEFRPDRPDVMYLVRNNPNQAKCQFLRSTDRGTTWKVKKSGWYSSSDPARYDGGARLAVTPAHPKRVYAILIGASKPGDDGFIGVWRSDNTGRTWSLPNGQVGGPYDDVHPNLMTISPYGGYQQGFYDLALGISASDPNEVLVGGTSLWRSTDAATSWSMVGGYGGTVPWIHPDIQDLQVFADEAWLTTDGGINVSTDLFRTHEARNKGISASDFWGFDSGLSSDVLVGGRYHNGDTGYFENYPFGRFLRLGGAESPTGYVNPGFQRTTIHSDIGGKILPRKVDEPTDNFSVTKYPNESYFTADSSEFLWHPHSWNTAWIGRDQVLWRTDDLGKNWTEVYTFGTDPASHVTDLEVALENPDLLYVVQQTPVRTVWKTADGGTSWSDITPPDSVTGGNNRRNMVISLNPENDRELWLALAGGPDDYKVFRTRDGGLTWTNETDTMLDGQSPTSILYQAGTDGGVLLGTDGAVFYRTDSTGGWQLHGSGFPQNAAPVRLKPLYAQAVVRAGCYRRAIWESDLCEPSRPVARIMVDRFTGNAGESFSFRSGSTMDERSTVSFQWHFQGGNPSTSTERNPTITYSNRGTYTVRLVVTDAAGLQDAVVVTDLLDVN